MQEQTQVVDNVLRSIRQIVRKISEHSKYLARESGLTLPQIMCLKVIGEHEQSELTVVRVSKLVQLSPATVSRIIDRLVKAELVLRERRSKDRRKVCLSLTAAGLERFQTLPVPLQDKFVRKLENMSKEEQREIQTVLSKLTSMMEAHEIDAAPMLTPGLDVKQSFSEDINFNLEGQG